MPSIVAIIPARMGSSRFPGKPLAKILGVPMIEHVRRRVALCPDVTRVIVATCDEEIAAVVRAGGGEAMMTSPSHERASDRVAEVAQQIPGDIFLMVQGDEPMVVPDMLTLALRPLLDDSSVVCSNLIAPIESEQDFADRNTIKVTRALDGSALYFSREAIPTTARVRFGSIPAFKQVCVIPFTREFLQTYTSLPPTPLEIAESVDMLRALEHGYRIVLVESPYRTQAIDEPHEIARVEAMMQDDPFYSQYAKFV